MSQPRDTNSSSQRPRLQRQGTFTETRPRQTEISGGISPRERSSSTQQLTYSGEGESRVRPSRSLPGSQRPLSGPPALPPRRQGLDSDDRRSVTSSLVPQQRTYSQCLLPRSSPSPTFARKPRVSPNKGRI